MTNTYDTSNEPLGSTAVKVLYNNASNLDEALNALVTSWEDRFGRDRKTWYGFEQDFYQLLQNSGFETPPLIYVDGSPLQVDRPTQLISRGGILYSVKLPASFPVDLSGTWAADEPLLVVRGDQSLRQDILAYNKVHDFIVVETVQDVRALPTSMHTRAMALGYYEAGDGGGGEFFVDPSELSSSDDGGSVLGNGWTRVDKRVLSIKQFGAKGDGITDDFSAMRRWAEATVKYNADWRIDAGDFFVNGNAPIILRTGGKAIGTVSVPKNNPDFYIYFQRDSAGVVIPTDSWGTLVRNSYNINAANAIGKNVFLKSTEVLADRLNTLEPYYYCREFIRVRRKDGTSSSGLACTYTDKTKLVATAFDPSKPITVENLLMRITGDGPDATVRPRLLVERDSVTFQGGGISNVKPATGFHHGPIVSQCADVVFIDYRINGASLSPGYGVQLADTIGVKFLNCEIHGCEHAITGRHNSDVTVWGGSYSDNIDDHWGCRWKIGGGVIVTPPAGNTAVSYAGFDIDIDDITVTGGNLILGVRTDTPYLGGNVSIKNVNVNSGAISSFYWLFGYTTPGGVSTEGRTFTVAPFMPDNVVIENIDIQSNQKVYIAYLGEVRGTANLPTKKITIQGNISSNRNMDLVLALKNATWQTGGTEICIDSQSRCNGGAYASIYPGAGHSGTSGKMKISIAGGREGSLAYAHDLCDSVLVEGTGVTSVSLTNSNVTVQGTYKFIGVEFFGGSFDPNLRNVMISSSVFSGNYSGLNPTYVSLMGNLALAGITGMPTNIKTSVVAPYV